MFEDNPGGSGAGAQPHPCLLIAWAPPGALEIDRMALLPSLVVGRHPECDLVLSDTKISARHVHISHANGQHWIEDLGSANGTFLDGEKVTNKQLLMSPGLIRIGNTVIVFHGDGGPLLEPWPPEQFGMAGRFHTGPLLQTLTNASTTARHLAIVGASGCGKEMAARAAASTMGAGSHQRPLVVNEGSRPPGDGGVSAAIFGVGEDSGGQGRGAGLVERGGGGVMLLDDADRLSQGVQASIVQLMRDGTFSRIGESQLRSIRIRIMITSGAAPPSYGLSPELLNLTTVVRVPSLRERVADIPSLFMFILEATFASRKIPLEPVMEVINGDHLEPLCLDGFPEDNVRGVATLCTRIASLITGGSMASEAIAQAFNERFGDGPVAIRLKKEAVATGMRPTARAGHAGAPVETPSHYEKHRETITTIFHQCNGSVAETEAALQRQGIQCSRRWLAVFLKQWGLQA